MQELRELLLETPLALLSPGTFRKPVLRHESERLRAPKTLDWFSSIPCLWEGRLLNTAEQEKGHSRDGDVRFPPFGHESIITSPQAEAQSRSAMLHNSRGHHFHREQHASVPGAAASAHLLTDWPRPSNAPLSIPSVLPGLCAGPRPAHSRLCGIFFFFLTSLLEYNCFTMVC